ncbi:MAG: hypothetical protein EP332_11635 [Bacteroidetes bacterium]|nr:MAG: hypothetical protein EP332_11635 [Bacteroidota bacterium]
MRKYLEIFLFLLAVVVLFIPSLSNGFPYLFSDSGTYINAGFTNEVPIDRPIAYSLFLRLSSFSYSLWIAVFVQLCLVAHVLYLFLKDIVQLKYPGFALVILTFLLGLSTALANVSNQVMPDIHAALLLLLIIIHFKAKTRLSYWISLFYLLVFIPFHNTNLLLFAGAWPLGYLLFGVKTWRKFGLVAVVYLLGLISIPLVNYTVQKEFFYSKSSGLFLTSSLLEMGVAQDYLARHCPEAPSFMCGVEHPEDAGSMAFLWSMESPLIDSACLARGGWGQCWKEKNDTMSVFVRNVLSDNQSRKLFIQHGWKAFGDQLSTFSIGHLTSQALNSSVYVPLTSHYPKDKAAYETANQFNEDLFFPELTNRQNWLLWLSLPLFVLVVYREKEQRKTFLFIALFIVVYLLANAAVCGVLSNPVNRYQARLMWLWPFFLLGWSLKPTFWKRSNDENTDVMEHSA